MKIGFLVLIALISAGVANASGGASAERPCPPTELPPIAPEDMHFIKSIVSGLEDNLNEQSCSTDACKRYLKWETGPDFKQPACSGFYVNKKTGEVGPLTKTIAKLFASDIEKYGNKSPFMQNYSQFEPMCPGFKNMDASEKVGFYSWMFETMAFHETTCSPIPQNHAANVPNGPAVGLYQLEYDPRIRSWRGPYCAVSRAEILTPDGNARCAWEIFRSQLEHYHDPFGTINAQGRRIHTAYWQSLNPTLPYRGHLKPTKRHPHPGEDAYHQIVRYLGYYPACGNTNSGK